jgi:hypothetical protein
VAATIFVQSHPQVKGIVYWASYPADDKLKDSGVKMISIYGSNDGLATNAKIEQYKLLQPADTVFVPIAGGNHGQFGDYGPQAGDNLAGIPAEEQWRLTAEATSGFLKSLLP